MPVMFEQKYAKLALCECRVVQERCLPFTCTGPSYFGLRRTEGTGVVQRASPKPIRSFRQHRNTAEFNLLLKRVYGFINARQVLYHVHISSPYVTKTESLFYAREHLSAISTIF